MYSESLLGLGGLPLLFFWGSTGSKQAQEITVCHLELQEIAGRATKAVAHELRAFLDESSNILPMNIRTLTKDSLVRRLNEFHSLVHRLVKLAALVRAEPHAEATFFVDTAHEAISRVLRLFEGVYQQLPGETRASATALTKPLLISLRGVYIFL